MQHILYFASANHDMSTMDRLVSQEVSGRKRPGGSGYGSFCGLNHSVQRKMLLNALWAACKNTF